MADAFLPERYAPEVTRRVVEAAGQGDAWMYREETTGYRATARPIPEPTPPDARRDGNRRQDVVVGVVFGWIAGSAVTLCSVAAIWGVRTVAVALVAHVALGVAAEHLRRRRL